MTEGRGRRIALRVGVPLLLVGIVLASAGALDTLRYRDYWTLSKSGELVILRRMDRWDGSLHEKHEWFVSSGLRRSHRCWSDTGRWRKTLWQEDGHIVYQSETWEDDGSRESYTFRTLETMSNLEIREEPPWLWGVEDRVLDAPWIGLGFPDWRESVGLDTDGDTG